MHVWVYVCTWYERQREKSHRNSAANASSLYCNTLPMHIPYLSVRGVMTSLAVLPRYS